MATTDQATQTAVNEWFAANPNATPEQVASTVQSIGGLTPQLAGALANYYGTDVNQIRAGFNQLTNTPTPLDRSSPQSVTGTAIPRPFELSLPQNVSGTPISGLFPQTPPQYIPTPTPLAVSPPPSIYAPPIPGYVAPTATLTGGLLTPPPPTSTLTVARDPDPFPTELQRNVNAWFTQNPSATPQQIVDAIKATGGLTPEYAQAIANKMGSTAATVQAAYTALNPPAPVASKANPVTALQDFVKTTSDPGQVANKIKELGGLSPDLTNVLVQKFGSNPTSVQTAYNELTTPGSLNRNADFLTKPNPRGFVIGDPAGFDVRPLVGLAASYFGAPYLGESLFGLSAAEGGAIAGNALINAATGKSPLQIATSAGTSFGLDALGNAVNIDPASTQYGYTNQMDLASDAANSANVANATNLGTGLGANAATYTGTGLQGANAANLSGMGGGQGLLSNATTSNLASMGGAQGLTTAGTGLTAGALGAGGTALSGLSSGIASDVGANSLLGATGGTVPFGGLGSNIGTTGLAAGTGSLFGSGAGTATGIVTPTGTVTPTDIITKVGTGVGTGLLTSALTGGGTGGGTGLNTNLIQGGLQTAGGVIQTQASKDAALKAQQDILAATGQATTGAQFRPVGVTTRFGASQFQIDPATGQLVSAGYTAAPEIVSAQNQLMNLGAGYLAQTPEQVAQQYLAKQYELLDPSRQRQLADIRNQNFQTGRGGLSVGSTGLRPSGAQGLMGANPELEAYYNALAQQDATLAANAQQAGQQQVTYGAGLFGQAGNLESLAQQPFTLGTSLGTAISGAGANAGRLSLTGQQLGAGYGTSSAATTSPGAYVLSGLGSPTSALGTGLANWLNSTTPIGTDVIPQSTFTGGITPSELANYQSMGIF